MNKFTSSCMYPIIFTCMVATYLATSLLSQFCVLEIMLIENYINIMDKQVHIPSIF